MSLPDVLDWMLSLSTRGSLTLVTVSAVVVHLVYKKYEPDPTWYLTTFLLLVVVPGTSSICLLRHFPSILSAYLFGYALFYLSLLTSITIYRISPWHPLAKYPGPLLAKLSILWLVRVARTGRRHIILKELHDKYGPYLRIGPNELSFVDAVLVPEIMSDLPKGPFYDGVRIPDNPPNLIATRSFQDHARKRKPWSHAFSASAIRDYSLAIARRAIRLSEELEKRTVDKVGASQSVDLSTWMSYFAFDFMGDMAFGGGFELMREGDVNGIWALMTDRMRTARWMGLLPWTTRTINKLPKAIEAVAQFRMFTQDRTLQRQAQGASVKDVFYHIAYEDADSSEKSSVPLSTILESVELAIIAGSDTTAATMAGIFYYVLANPKVYETLRKEIDDTFPPGEGDALDMTKLSGMTYLNAVINETLRLQPPANTLQRAPALASGGKWIGKHFIPEGNAVTVSPYAIHRNPQYFSPFPDTFLPERWLSSSPTAEKEEKGRTTAPMVLTPQAYIPFSTGPANCVGRGLALAQMRAVVALVLQRFDVRFAEGSAYNSRSTRWEDGLEEMFVLKAPPLPVQLTLRT